MIPGEETTLRYAIQLITTSSLVAAKRKSQEVDIIDIRKVHYFFCKIILLFFNLFEPFNQQVYSMFMDLKRSTDYLVEHQKDYLYSEESTLTKQVEKMAIE